MSRYFSRDQRFATPDGPRFVVEVLRASKLVKLFNPANHDFELISEAQLRQLIADETYVLEEKKPVGAVVSPKASPAALKRQLLSLQIVAHLERSIRAGDTPREAVKKLQLAGFRDADGTPIRLVSERTMFRWLKDKANGHKTLLPSFSHRGNRTARIDEAVTRVVLDLVETNYAKPKSRITLPAIASAAQRICRDSGLIPPKGRISVKLVRRIVTTRWNPDLDFRRLDPRIAKAAKAVAAVRIYAGCALQRVEMDTVHLPIVVRAHGKIHSNVYLMLAIDCATSMLLGWRLMLAAPTIADTLECLKCALLPKASRFAQLGIKAVVDPYGLFIELIVDNGPENAGEELERVATLGIIYVRLPANAPYLKPFVERFNRSLKEAIEGLPGSTRFDGKDGARTDAALSEDLMTPQELERFIVRWAFESWAHHPLGRFITESYHVDEHPGLTPAERWQYFERTESLPLPPRPSDIDALCYRTIKRSLSPKTGVSLLGCRFKGPHLVRLIHEYGPDATVEVIYNPSDYRMVRVKSRDSNELLTLVNPEAPDDGPAYTFAEFRAERLFKQAKARELEDHPIKAEFERDRDEKVFGNPAGRAAKKARHKAVRKQQAVERAKKNPLPDTPPSSSSDIHIADDAIPSFAVARSAGKASRGGSK